MKIFLALLFVSSIAQAQTKIIHKFVKVGVAFTYQADNGASIAPQQVTQSNVNPEGTVLRIFFNNAWYINVLLQDSMVINGSGVTGSLITKRNQLLTDVFPSLTPGGGGGGSTDTANLSNRINGAYSSILSLPDSSGVILVRPNGTRDTISFQGTSLLGNKFWQVDMIALSDKNTDDFFYSGKVWFRRNGEIG